MIQGLAEQGGKDPITRAQIVRGLKLSRAGGDLQARALADAGLVTLKRGGRGRKQNEDSLETIRSRRARRMPWRMSKKRPPRSARKADISNSGDGR